MIQQPGGNGSNTEQSMDYQMKAVNTFSDVKDTAWYVDAFEGKCVRCIVGRW